MQSRDCLQIKNEEEEESWQEGDQRQNSGKRSNIWKKSLKRKRMEGNSLNWMPCIKYWS